MLLAGLGNAMHVGTNCFHPNVHFHTVNVPSRTFIAKAWESEQEEPVYHILVPGIVWSGPISTRIFVPSPILHINCWHISTMHAMVQELILQSIFLCHETLLSMSNPKMLQLDFVGGVIKVSRQPMSYPTSHLTNTLLIVWTQQWQLPES